MAVGPLARILAQVVILGVSVLSRALPAAYAQALQNAKKGGASSTAQQVLRKTIAKEEAMQILNLSEKELTPEAILKQYERYFSANSVEKGGSFYLQSKVVRAKEMLEEYIAEKKREETTQQSQ